MAAFPPMTILTRRKHALPKIATRNYSNRGLLALLAHSTNYHVRRRLAGCALILFASRCSSASCCVGCAPVKVRFLCMRTTDCMESCRKEDFSETSAVHKGEFRNFLNIGVAKVHTLKQSATVACMRSDSYKMLCESKCGDSRGAKTTRC